MRPEPHRPGADIIPLPVAFRPVTPEGRQAAHLAAFARHRRAPDDVYWLKEVAECLGILVATGARPGPRALEPLRDYYDTLDAHCRFYPQYYRFHLAIALDLEALGMAGETSRRIARFVAAEGLAGQELSDLQRAEAARLLGRAGIAGMDDPATRARLQDFAGRARHFSVPNKKTAYELTHIVYYLTDYGRTEAGLGRETERSLLHVGILAHLEQNADLLAEVAIALDYLSAEVPQAWRDWLRETWQGSVGVAAPDGPVADDYHQYVVLGWAHAVLDRAPVFDRPVPEGPVSFHIPRAPAAPLRDLSRSLAELGPARSGDWHHMRPRLMESLTDEAQAVVAGAEAATPVFDSFFAGFARAGQGAAMAGVC